MRGGLDRRGFLRAAVALPLAATACTSTPAAAPAPLPPQVGASAAAAVPPSLPTGELAHAGSGRPQVALTFHGSNSGFKTHFF